MLRVAKVEAAALDGDEDDRHALRVRLPQLQQAPRPREHALRAEDDEHVRLLHAFRHQRPEVREVGAVEEARYAGHPRDQIVQVPRIAACLHLVVREEAAVPLGELIAGAPLLRPGVAPLLRARCRRPLASSAAPPSATPSSAAPPPRHPAPAAAQQQDGDDDDEDEAPAAAAGGDRMISPPNSSAGPSPGGGGDGSGGAGDGGGGGDGSGGGLGHGCRGGGAGGGMYSTSEHCSRSWALRRRRADAFPVASTFRVRAPHDTSTITAGCCSRV